jgi:hypothetical protein
MTIISRRIVVAVVLMLMAALAVSAPRVTVTYPQGVSAEALDGRLILVFSPGGELEPRLQVNWDQDAIPFFAMDVEAGSRARSRHLTERSPASRSGRWMPCRRGTTACKPS